MDFLIRQGYLHIIDDTLHEFIVIYFYAFESVEIFSPQVLLYIGNRGKLSGLWVQHTFIPHA